MRKSCQWEHGAVFGSISSSISLEISQDCAEGRTNSSMSPFLSTPSGKGKSCCVPVVGHSSATGPSRHQTRAAPQGPGVTSHSQMATSSQEFVCITGGGKKVRKENLTSWCNCSFPSPGVKISESNFILTARLERLCFLVISQLQFLP